MHGLQSGGGSMGGFNWEDVVSGGAKSRQAAEEAFYGFGDFFKDLEKDRCVRTLPLPALSQAQLPSRDLCSLEVHLCVVNHLMRPVDGT